MQQRYNNPFQSHRREIEQLHRDIAFYIATVDSFIVREQKCWKDKKAVLEVALQCLSGNKLLADLHSAMKDPSYWKDKDGWWDPNRNFCE